MCRLFVVYSPCILPEAFFDGSLYRLVVVLMAMVVVVVVVVVVAVVLV